MIDSMLEIWNSVEIATEIDIASSGRRVAGRGWPGRSRFRFHRYKPPRLCSCVWTSILQQHRFRITTFCCCWCSAYI